MQLKEFKKSFTEKLSGVFPSEEMESIFFLLIEDCLNLKRIDLVLNPDFVIETSNLKKLKDALKRLKQQEPIQYILGKTEFFDLPFLVNKHTLIPRPETEELVRLIIDEVKSKKLKSKSLKILDIGTGSGCIAISLAKQILNTKITAIDISADALKVAEQNAKLNGVSVDFVELDILSIDNLTILIDQLNSNFSARGNTTLQFDIIVSNPPYVRELEKTEIKPNVLENEPHDALFVPDDDPLIFYKKIADLSKNHLSENGKLYFEINQYLGEETLNMLQEKGFTKVELLKDVFNNDRMIWTKI